MFKKVLCGLLAAVMVASITGCSKGSSTGTSSKGPKEITVADWSFKPDDPAWKSITSELAKAEPDLKVNQVYIASSGDVISKVSTMVAGGQKLDVVQADATKSRAFCQSNILEPLESYFKKDNIDLNKDYFTQSISDHTWDGKIYGFPTLTMTYFIFYNKDLFDKAGIAYPKNDWTIDEFLSDAQKLTDAKNNQYGYSFQPWVGTHDLSWVYAFGGKYLTDDVKKATINSDGTVQGYQFLSDLINKYKVAMPPVGSNTAPAAVSFASGKIAMNWSGTWDIVGTDTTGGKTSKWNFKWGVVMPPKGPNGQFPIVIDNAWSIINKSTQKDGAWDFIKFFNGAAAQKILADNGNYPALKSVADSSAFAFLDKDTRNTIITATEKGVSRPTKSKVWADIELQSRPYLDKVLLAQGNTKDTLTQLNTFVNGLIAEQNQSSPASK